MSGVDAVHLRLYNLRNPRVVLSRSSVAVATSGVRCSVFSRNSEDSRLNSSRSNARGVLNVHVQRKLSVTVRHRLNVRQETRDSDSSSRVANV